MRHLQITLRTLSALVLLAWPAATHAQVPPRVFDCGPASVVTGDFVSVGVGYPNRNTEPGQFRVRFLSASGGVLAEHALALEPGQSRSVRYTVPAAAPKRLVLLRAEIVIESGPAEPRLLGTFQHFGPGLTYGPNWECSGDTGTRGPA